MGLVWYLFAVVGVADGANVAIQATVDHSERVEQLTTACMVDADVAIIAARCKEMPLGGIEGNGAHRSRVRAKETRHTNMLHILSHLRH